MTAPHGAADAAEQTVRPGRPDRAAAAVLGVACSTILLDALDLSITQVALPTLGESLELSASALPWVANAYVLTYGGLLLVGGRLSDRVGARRMLLTGLLVFGAMSTVAGLAPSGPVLLVARAVQGVGAAMTVPAGVALIARTYAEGPPRNRALGVFAAFASAGFSLGLVLGGVLTDTVGWRWIFLVKVPIVVAVVAVLLARVPRDRGGADVPLGAVPASCVTAAVLLSVFALTRAGEAGATDGLVLATAGLALLALTAFVLLERRSDAPLVPVRLLRNATSRAAQLASLTVLAAPFGYAFLTSGYLHEVGGYSAIRTGLAMLPGAALSAVVSRWLAPALIARWGLRVTGSSSLLVVAAGLALLARSGSASSYVGVILPSVVLCFGLGMGLAYPVFNAAALVGVEEVDQGIAAGLQNTSLQLGGGVGLAVAGVAATAALTGGDADGWTSAIRTGALACAALPAAGALMALALPGRRRPQHPDQAETTDERGEELPR